MIMKKTYQKPIIETSLFRSPLLAGSNQVGLITDGGSNAAKSDSSNLWDDEDD